MADLTITNATPVSDALFLKGPAGEAIPKGRAVRIDVSTGKFMLSKGTDAAEARCCGVSVTAATVAGQTISVQRAGIVDVGNALSALTYDDDVFLSDTDDGILADMAGSVTKIVGRVVPIWNQPSAPDKALLLTT